MKFIAKLRVNEFQYQRQTFFKFKSIKIYKRHKKKVQNF